MVCSTSPFCQTVHAAALLRRVRKVLVQRAARRRKSRLLIFCLPGRTHAVCASVHMLAFRLTTIHSQCTRERTRALCADASAVLSPGNLNDLREIRGTSKHARVYPDGECGEIRFAPCCLRSPRRAPGIPQPIQCDASVTGWMRPNYPTWTACIGRKSTGAALRAVLASRRVVSTTARREGRRRACAALTRAGGCRRQRFG